MASLSFLFLSFLYFTASVMEDHALLSFSVRSLVRQGFGKPLFQGMCPGILSMQPEHHQFHCHVHLCQSHINFQMLFGLLHGFCFDWNVPTVLWLPEFPYDLMYQLVEGVTVNLFYYHC